MRTPITCEIIVKDDGEIALYLNTNNHTFEETEKAVRVIIAELERKLESKAKCPFYPGE